MAAVAESSGNIIRETLQEFATDECTTMAASLAYYTIFSLPGLLVIVITIAGSFTSQKAAQSRIEGEIQGVVGKAGVQQIDTMMDAAKNQKRGVWASVIGIAVLLFGATGVVAQLQYACNKIWNVKPDPRAGGVRQFIFKRILSFAMILAIAFLLLVSLVLTTILSAVGQRLGTWLPKTVSKEMLLGLDFGVSLVVVSVLFAAMFKWLPDAKVAWRDAILGGFLTGILFMVGKFLLGLYLGRQDPTAYGPAAALVLILIWTYYSSMIVFFGAEFTQVWARRHGRQAVPAPGAIRIEDCPTDSTQMRPAVS